jgi:hypothetical protein
MKNKPRTFLAWSLGFFIWMPSIALSIANAWGLQFTLLCSLMTIFVYVTNWNKNEVSYSKGLTWLASLSALLLLSSAFGALAFSRSILSALSELTLLIVAFAVYIVIIYDVKTRQAFLDGFYAAGIFTAAVAIIQFIGLNLGFTIFAWEFYNPSFSLFPVDSAMLHQRAYAFTPEPSILSALLLSVIAMQTMRVKKIGDHSEWLKLALLLVADLSSASQSLLFVPMAVFSGIWMAKPTMNSNKKSRTARFYIALFLVLGITGLTTLESLQRNFINRIMEVYSGSTEDSSFGSRSESMLASFRMFMDYPVFGTGPGAATELISRWVRNGVEVGAASALFRNIAELGFIYLLVWLLAAIVLWSLAFKVRRREMVVEGQLIVIAAWFAISAVVFVGYRLLYQNSAWFGIVLGLSQLIVRPKAQFKHAG